MTEQAKPKKPRSKYQPSTTWKSVEAKILAFWGAKRRGAHTGQGFRGSGLPDNSDELPGWAIEIKHSKRPTWGLMQEAVEQARTNRIKPDDIPVAVIHGEGMQFKDSLVVMKLSDFSEFFINEVKENGN